MHIPLLGSACALTCMRARKDQGGGANHKLLQEVHTLVGCGRKVTRVGKVGRLRGSRDLDNISAYCCNAFEVKTRPQLLGCPLLIYQTRI